MVRRKKLKHEEEAHFEIFLEMLYSSNVTDNL